MLWTLPVMRPLIGHEMDTTQKHSENLANQGQVILPPELRKIPLLIKTSNG
jgi:hypothetical protein